MRPESLCVSHRAPSHLVHIATRHVRAEQRIVTRYSGDRARLLDGTERPRPLFQSPPRLSHAARLRRPRRQGLATFTGSAPARAVGSLGRALGRRSFQPDKRAPGPPCTEKRSRPHLLTVAAAARPASLRVGPAVLPGRPAGLPGRAGRAASLSGGACKQSPGPGPAPLANGTVRTGPPGLPRPACL